MNKLTQEQLQLIYKTLLLDGRKIVLLLDVHGEPNAVSCLDLNANIYCIDDGNNILWQIHAEPTKFKIDPFTSINKNETGDIQARRFSGFKYSIDPETGDAKIISWDK